MLCNISSSEVIGRPPSCILRTPPPVGLYERTTWQGACRLKTIIRMVIVTRTGSITVVMCTLPSTPQQTHMHTCTYIRTHTHTHLHTHIFKHPPTQHTPHTPLHTTHSHMHTCTYIRTHTHTHLHTHIFKHPPTQHTPHTHLHTPHTHLHTHPHTHLHTHLQTCVVNSSFASRLLSRCGADFRLAFSLAAAGADLERIDIAALVWGGRDLDLVLVGGWEKGGSSVEASDWLEASWLELQPGRGRILVH